jgi:hypothetical protein
MDVIKKKSYYPLCIQNERNEAVGARGNENREHTGSSFLH